MFLDEFEDALDARLSRYKLDFPHVSRELRDGGEPIARLSRRNYVLLLYAYWESIVKQTVRDYIAHVENAADHYNQLITPLRLAHRRNHLSRSYLNVRAPKRNVLSDEMAKFEACEETLTLPDKPALYDFSLFDSRSNLNWSRLERILTWIGVSLPHFHLTVRDPYGITQLSYSDVTKKNIYDYGPEPIRIWLDTFLKARNSLAHSALDDPPCYEHCIFFGLFISALLSWFSDVMRDAAENELWRVRV